MSILAVPVSIIVASISDTPGPVAGGRVLFTLTDADLVPGDNGGIIVPSTLEVILSASGTASVELYTNTGGTQGTQYRVELFDANGAKAREWLATVPASACYLHEILSALAPSSVDDAQAAVLASQGHAATAAAAQQATAQLKTDVEAIQADVVAKANQVSTDATQVGLDKQAVADDKVAAEQAVTDATTQADLSLQWATSLAVVTGGLYGSRYYAQQAQASASAAGQAATDAGTSATTSGQMRDQTVQARDDANTAAGAAAGSANLAQSWATSLAVVGGGFYGARKYAQDAAAVATLASNWAQSAISPSGNAGDWSAKTWAQGNLAGLTYGGSAKDWAQSVDKPDGVSESSKTYAAQAAVSAQQGAGYASSAGGSANQASVSAATAADASSKALAIFGTAADLNAAQQIMLGYANTAQGAVGQAQAAAAQALSVVQQDLSGVTAAALHRSPNPVTAQFVYDTSKDSDGGAWIERVAHTSWMQEALNGAWLPATTPNGMQSELQARLSNATLGPELIPSNADFAAAAGWTVNGTATIANGVATATAGAGNNITRNDISITAGQLYEFSVVVGAGSGGAPWLNLYLDGQQASGVVRSPTTGTYRAYFVAAATKLAVATLQADAGPVAVDSASIKAVTAINTKSGDYYQSAVDGKFYRLWKNIAPNTALSGGTAGTVGAGAVVPTGWTFINTGGTIAFPAANQIRFTSAGNRPALGLDVASTGGQVYTQSFRVVAVASNVDCNLGNLCNIGTNPVGTVVAFRVNGVTQPGTYMPQAGDNVEVTVTAGSAGGTLQFRFGPGAANAPTCDITLADFQIEYGSVKTALEQKPATADKGTTEVFRGNTAKFPRLAAIVGEGTPGQANGSITIYDLTQPGRPMWMRFTQNSAATASVYQLWRAGRVPVGIYALNGELCWVLNQGSADGGAGGLIRTNFVSDTMRRHAVSDVAPFAAGVFSGGLAQRNSNSLALVAATANLVLAASNAIAMMVRPTAPTDPVTQLPVPTIAVAVGTGNAGQVGTVLMDDGSAVNYSQAGNDGLSVAFTKRGEVAWTFSNSSAMTVLPLQTANVANTQTTGRTYSSGTTPNIGTGFKVATAAGALLAMRQSAANRVTGMRENPSTPGGGPTFDITGTYNTGWMAGDIRRCWLAGVDSGVLSGAGLLTGDDSTFTSGTGAWTAPFNSTIAASGGQLVVTAAGGNNPYGRYLLSGLVPGRAYRLSFDYLGKSNAATAVNLAVGNTSSLSNSALVATFQPPVANGQAVNFAADANGIANIQFVGVGFNVGDTFTIDNVQVTPLVPDRSVKAKPASINGTLALTAVATAAQRVAASGFSATNYLQEAYSADLDFGTGAWAAGGWMNVPATIPQANYGTVGSGIAHTGLFFTPNGGTGVDNGDGTFSLTNSAQVRFTYPLASLKDGAVYEVSMNVSAYTGPQTIVDLCDADTQVNGGASAINATGVKTFRFTRATYDTTFRFVDVLCGAGGAITATYPVLTEVAVAPIIHRGGASGAYWFLGVDQAGKLVAEAYDGTTTRRVTSTAAYNTGAWVKAGAHYTADGKLALQANGAQVASATGTPLLTLNNAAALATVGNSFALNAAFPGSLALVKAGATVPFAEQSAWMYAQERAMFADGAQVTLPDTGNVVDMAYDELLGRLKVASAANECSFAGLVRVESAAAPAGSFIKVDMRSGVKLAARSTTNPGVDVSFASQNLREQLQRRAEDAKAQARNVLTLDTDSVASQTDFPLPVGTELVECYSNRLPQREGATKDYTRLFDGFRETVRFGAQQGTNWIRLNYRRAA